MLATARRLAAAGRDDEAKQVYVDLLRAEPAHRLALAELAALALAGGHVSAARTACRQAVSAYPRDAAARVQLGNLLVGDAAFEDAHRHYMAALGLGPVAAIEAAAHQGLARVFEALGDVPAAALHRRLGFTGHATVSQPYRAEGCGTPLLLLVSARNGNIPLQGWALDRYFAISVIYTEFYDPSIALPPHALVLNAIGDADLCAEALDGAEAILAGGTAPVINPPTCVRATSRAGNAGRLGGLPGVVAPKIHSLEGTGAENLDFPLLVRAPGFHTGQHFTLVERPDKLAAAMASMPAGKILAIQYLDARGADGMARKYRVMFIGGAAYPLHLAISADWKVHYFSAAMAADAAYREEEREFLNNMPKVLGAPAMAALAAINETLGLDYAGIDFGLDPAGRLLLFEANATMAIVPPNADPIWDYRRPAIDRALSARVEMLRSKVGRPSFCEQKEAKKLL